MTVIFTIIFILMILVHIGNALSNWSEDRQFERQQRAKGLRKHVRTKFTGTGPVIHARRQVITTWVPEGETATTKTERKAAKARRKAARMIRAEYKALSAQDRANRGAVSTSEANARLQAKRNSAPASTWKPAESMTRAERKAKRAARKASRTSRAAHKAHKEREHYARWAKKRAEKSMTRTERKAQRREQWLARADSNHPNNR